MMRFFLSVSCILFSCNLIAQGILLNGNFEEENICTEYKVSCAPEAWISSSDGFNNYFKDANRAHEGQHCMAIEAGHAIKSFQRTYIRSQLVCGLRKGNRYRLELFVKSPHAILDSMGVYFTTTDPLLDSKPLQYLTPSIFFSQGITQFKNDSSWQKLTLQYQASGKEVFISVGNFSKRDIRGATGIDKENHFFVFVDDVTLVPVDSNEKLCQDWQQARNLLYDMNERHEFLRRSLKSQRTKPVAVTIKPTTILVIDTLLLPDVLFAPGKKDLELASHKVLDSFCRYISGKIVDSIVIEGHTDNTGTAVINEQLAVDRAVAVKTYLQQCAHLLQSTIVTRGKASYYPVADNNTPAGRQQNRRVELLFYIRE